MEIAAESTGRRDWEQDVVVCRSTYSMSNSTTCPHPGVLPGEHYRHRGIALVWTAVFLLVIILLIGLSLDTARVYLVAHQLHNAADAAALAGGPWVKRDQPTARDLAQFFAAENIADNVAVDLDTNDDNLPDGDIIIGKYGYFPPEQTGEEQGKFLFIPYDPSNPGSVNALAVIASRDVDERLGHRATQQVPLIFGPMVGIYALDLAGNWLGKRGPYAIAITGGGSGAGLICLRHDGTGLHAQGTGDLIVNNLTGDPDEGAIQVNSGDDEISITLNGKPGIVAETINVHAEGFSQVGAFDLYENTDVWLGQPRMPDPLSWLNEPGFKPSDPACEHTDMLSDLGAIVIQNDDEVPTTPILAGYYSGG